MTAFDPHPNLQDIIDQWTSRRLDFLLTSGETGSGTTPGGGWPKGRPRAIETRWRQGATRIGISYAEYRMHRLAGERWCGKHRGWALEADFHSLRISYCRPCWRTYHRRIMRERAGLSGRTITPRNRVAPAPEPAPSRWRLGPNYPDHGRTA